MGLPSTYRVAGQRPGGLWNLNPAGHRRSINELRALAKDYVAIPDDVEFFEAEFGELMGTLEDLAAGREMETARIAAVTEDAEGYVH